VSLEIKSNSSNSSSARPYHARIFRLYMGYLKDKKSWSDADIHELLEDLNVDESRIADDASWFDLDFANRFMDLVEAKLPNENIAFGAGQYIQKNAFSATIYHLMRGLISVSRLYQLLSTYTPYFTKASRMLVLKAGRNTALVESRPFSSELEKPYMCENRKGILSGLPQIFNLPMATIVETECFHRGADRCLYQIKWNEDRFPKFIYPVALLLLLGILGYRSGLSPTVATAVLICSICAYLVFYMYRANQAQRKELEIHNTVLESSVRDNEKKNRELELISQIAKLTHALATPDEMAKAVVQSVCELLQYDRSMLLTVDTNRSVLKVSSHFGFSPEHAQLMEEAEFNIRPDNTTGFFIKVVNSKLPVLIENVDEHIQKLSPRSQKFAKILGAKSFVAVPLFNQSHEVLGVLSVDYVRDDKRMSVSDQDLLVTLADHISIGVHNSRTLEELEHSLQVSREHSKAQQSLGRVFQKFVPTELATELCSTNDESMQGKLLEAVKKKSVAILFGDIVGFTALSQQMSPECVVELLNTCFSKIEPIITKHGGFIDKFTGDGFMAVFDTGRSCENAVMAGAETLIEIPKICESLKILNLPAIDFGFGLHYGEAILGNVGSERRLNFTVIGETVNLASRLESYTREVGPNNLCASAVVMKESGKLYEWRPLGAVNLKGFQDSIEIFQLLVPKISRADRVSEPLEQLGK